MKLKDNPMEAIVLSLAWPGGTAGDCIAVKSTLSLYLERFSGVHFICLSDRSLDKNNAELVGETDWTHIPVAETPMWRRFLQSLYSSLPAVTIRYAQRKSDVLKEISRIVEATTSRLCIILEISPMACFVPDIVARHPTIPIAIHSHDIMSEAFEAMCRLGTPLNRLAWKWEVMKIRRFEKKMFSLVQQHWTITLDDAEAFQKHLGIPTDGTIGIFMDMERYKEVKSGEATTVVYIGSTDIRKWQGLLDFVEISWGKILADVPDARLILAGRGTEVLNDPSRNIDGLGFVEDDRPILEKGQIFINPQMSGSGLQLKSVVAMLAGRTLVSAQTAITGVTGEDGREFIVENSMEHMGARIVALMRNPEQAYRIGTAAQLLAMRFYNKQHFLDASRPLIDDFILKCAAESAPAPPLQHNPAD